MLQKMEVFSSQVSAPELQIGGTSPNTDLVQLRNVEGLGPVKANITTTPTARLRGETFVGKSLPNRNIVLTLGFNPDWEDNTITSLRQVLYAYFMTGEWVNLRFFSDYLPPVDISGYVESFDPNMFSKDPEVQVSIICPNPDFVDIDPTEVVGITTDGTDENELNYIGTVPTGFKLRLDSTAGAYSGLVGVTNKTPAINYFELSDVDIDDDPEIYLELNTNLGQRYVQTVQGGVVTSQLKNITNGIVWPELTPGQNLFSVTTDIPGDQTWTLTYHNRFGGL